MNKKRIKTIPNLAPAMIMLPAFCLGVVFQRLLDLSFYLLFGFYLSTLILGIIFKKNKYFTIPVVVLSFLSGELLYKNITTKETNHIDSVVRPASIHLKVKGKVATDPEVRTEKTTFLFRADNILFENRDIRTSGMVLVNYYGMSPVSYGKVVILEGKLFKPYNFSGGFDYRAFLNRRGIYRILSVNKENNVQSLKDTLSNPLKKLSFWLKSKIKRCFAKYLDFAKANLLNGIILGERANLAPLIKEAFVRTGTAHILAISGLNVGVLAFFFLVLFKALNIPKKTRFIITIIFLLIHAVMVGLQPSIVRATVMGVILLVGLLLQRQVNIYNSLAISALVILCVNPNQLFDIGFQLSFLSVYAIVCFSGRIDAFFMRGNKINKALQFVLKSFSVSLSATLGTFGIIAYNFKIISLISILANLVIVPLVNIILVLGFGLFLVDVFVPYFSVFFAKTISVSLSILVLAALKLSNLPFSCITW